MKQPTGIRNIKLTLAYDGSAYHGFQRQGNALAIQEVLEKALSKIFKQEIRVIGAARTDTGVHAYGQVVNFCTSCNIPVERIPLAARGILPDDIVLCQAEEVALDFHARHNAHSKLYRYQILNRNLPDPLRRNYVWHKKGPLSVPAMQQGLQQLTGTHDFSAFRSAGGPPISPVRTLYKLSCQRQAKEEDLIEFVVWGSGFLYHMVRNIVGTIVAVGAGKMSQAKFTDIFISRERSHACLIAPPQGLYLHTVQYQDDFI